MNNNDSNQNLQGSQSVATEAMAEAGKQAVKVANKTATKAGEKTLSAIFKSIIGEIGTTALVGILAPFALMLIVSIFLCAMPANTLFSPTTSTADVTAYHMLEGFNKVKSYKKDEIVMALNNKYGCKGTIQNISGDEDTGYLYSTDTCEINITFVPKIEEYSKAVNAYIDSINGAITLYGGEEEVLSEDEAKFDTLSDNVLTIDEDGNAELSDYGYSYIQENDSEYINSQGASKLASAHDNAEYIFKADTSDTWEYNNFRKGTKTIQEDVCYMYDEDPYTVWQSLKRTDSNATYSQALSQVSYTSVPCNGSFDFTRKETKVIEAMFGDVVIHMSYDMSYYKALELEQCIENLVGQNYPEETKNEDGMRTLIEKTLTYDDAKAMVDSTIQTYYMNYISMFEDYEAIAYMGVNPIFLRVGEQGWDGDAPSSSFNYAYYLRQGKVEQVWQHIEKIAFVGRKEFGTWRQCTEFSLGYLIDTYGINIVKGNGQDYVANLVNDYGWKLLDTPAPGSIFSASATPKYIYGHTGVILSVHDGKITVMEGNQDEKGGARIYDTTIEQFINERYAGRMVKFAAP